MYINLVRILINIFICRPKKQIYPGNKVLSDYINKNPLPYSYNIIISIKHIVIN